MNRVLTISLDPCIWDTHSKLDAARTWHIMVPVPWLALAEAASH